MSSKQGLQNTVYCTFKYVYCIDIARDMVNTRLILSLVHGAAVGWVLVGAQKLVDIGSDGGQGAVQLFDGFLSQVGLPAHDPRKLRVQHQEVSAAVDQSVVVIVGGQHPVWSGGRVWKGESISCQYNKSRNV